MLASMPFMLLVSHHDSPLLGWQKVAFTLELWAMASAWGGLLESKKWALGLEALRLVAMGAMACAWAPAAVTPLVLGWLGVSLGWLTKVRLARPGWQAEAGSA